MELDLTESKTWSSHSSRQGLQVRVKAGTVWVTQESDPEDHVVAAPAVFEAKKPGRVVLFALTKASVEVDPPASARRH